MSPCLCHGAGLPARSHVPPAHRMWPHSCALSKYPHLLPPGMSYHHLLQLSWAQTSKSSSLLNSLPFSIILVACFSSAALLNNVFSPYFVYLSICILLQFSPFPHFSPMLHQTAKPTKQHQRTEPGPNLPLSLSLSVPGAAAEACPYRPLSSAHLLYLSAGTLPFTHCSPPFTQRSFFTARIQKR